MIDEAMERRVTEWVAKVPKWAWWPMGVLCGPLVVCIACGAVWLASAYFYHERER